MYCAAGVAVKTEDSVLEATPHRCKRWACEICNPINRAAVIRHAINGKPKALLTLTLSSLEHPDQSEAASALKRGLRLLRLRLRRHPRLADFEFLAVFEAHKNGHPHLHLLIRGGFIPWNWLRMAWSEITGAQHVDIRKIKGRRDAARYVAKYIGKDLHAFAGCKRWWRSHGYDLPDSQDEQQPGKRPAWWHVSMSLAELAEAFSADGWTVDSQSARRLTARPPPHGPPDPRTHLYRWRIRQRRQA